MTKLTKKVRRATGKFVVTLYPAEGERGERIEIRESGRRHSYSLELGVLYTRLVVASVEPKRTGVRKRTIKRGSLL